jgi:hypothetical protein
LKINTLYFVDAISNSKHYTALYYNHEDYSDNSRHLMGLRVSQDGFLRNLQAYVKSGTVEIRDDGNNKVTSCSFYEIPITFNYTFTYPSN